MQARAVLEQSMRLALQEAKISLCEGNHGFGAVIVKDGAVIASSHDKENTESDSTSHAEINVIREASRMLGKKLTGCVLVSTHEPCPMCAAAVVWSGITTIAYGYSIQEALKQGRTRISFPCADVFGKAGAEINIYTGVLEKECSILYRDDVRKEIERLRFADNEKLCELNEDSIRRRTAWYQENKQRFEFVSQDILHSGYRLLLERFRITADQAPVIQRTEAQLVFHSMNFCPTLEACKILGLDTRDVCKRLNENSTDMLLKQIDKRLCFSRNYAKLRPYESYCEEMISISEK